MKAIALFLVPIILSLDVHAQTRDYCLITLCQVGRHIGCGNKNTFALTCPRDAKQVTSGSVQTAFVNTHNYVRSQVGLGNVTGYEPSMRMATMVWDTELATLALMLAKSCESEEDTCRNTDRFTTVGQNIASLTRIGKYDAAAVVEEVVNTWFLENVAMTKTYVAAFVIDTATINTYKHFAEMIVDKNTRVGCAIVDFTEGTKTRINIVCNYASMYVEGSPLYASGCTTAQCLKGKNPTYPGLCASTELFEPNWS